MALIGNGTVPYVATAPTANVKGTQEMTGVVLPEGTHLEPTIGQIWPR
jgi:hypothetical protein